MRTISKISIAISIFFYCFLSSAKGQDAEFSQFYSNPLYLNPALAGTGECSRVFLNYRNQWPNLPAQFVTYNAGVDFQLEGISSGVGFAVVSDNAGNGVFVTSRATAIYAYHLRLGDDSQLNAGMGATLHYETFNFDKLIFQSDIENLPEKEEAPDNSTVILPDFAFGLMFGIRGNFFLGIAGDHLLEPSVDHYNTQENKLFRKITVHTGMNFGNKGSYGANKNFVFSPQLLFQMQGAMHQLNGGINVEREPLVLGVWYRHNFENSDAVIFLAGIKWKRLRVGYSYDYSLSGLKSASGGANEVSLQLLISCNKKRNRKGAIKCPEF